MKTLMNDLDSIMTEFISTTRHFVSSLTLMINQFCIILYARYTVVSRATRHPRSTRIIYRHDETRYHLYACP